MIKVLILALVLSQTIFASSGIYKSSVYPMCDSKQHLDDWTQFDVDGDTASKRAYYGNKCFILSEDIAVSGINTDWGKVSFMYKGYRLWGYREGIK